jgi:hypothetical protein
VSVSLWLLFVAIYGRELLNNEDTEYYEHTALSIPPDILQPTLTKITQPTLDYLTTLNIINQTMSRSEWVSLAKLKTLCTLLIDVSDCIQSSNLDNLDNQVVRAWATHAVEAGGFPQLRSLVLFTQKGISLDSLRYLSRLPLLQLCNLGTTARAIADENEQSVCRNWEHWPEGGQ